MNSLTLQKYKTFPSPKYTAISSIALINMYSSIFFLLHIGGSRIEGKTGGSNEHKVQERTELKTYAETENDKTGAPMNYMRRTIIKLLYH